MTTPTFENDPNIDVHAPASTYYTTGENARQRTRTYTVVISSGFLYKFIDTDLIDYRKVISKTQLVEQDLKARTDVELLTVSFCTHKKKKKQITGSDVNIFEP